jgi:hypothetical protein
MSNLEVVKLADAMNFGAAQEIEGAALDDLAVGAVVAVETGHNAYRVENRGGGMILISGHPQYCPEPVLVELHGSTARSILKFRFIGRGLHMEFHHPAHGIVRTSPIKDVRVLSPARETSKAS